MKYDFKMELDESTSVGKIAAHIRPNSKVLEFGPGNGRMTSYLMEEKNCEVSIVELDQELYQHVSQFATAAYFGNIDEEGWSNYFAGQTFDYIIFADVLEHLMNPPKVLARVKEFLAPAGQILMTFPNLAHNSVLIGLFNNQLNWNQYGLLDATHKSFYLQASFEKLFQSVGLYIAKEDFTFNEVGNNEIPTDYDDLPVMIQSAFRARPFGEVYQYFYALTKEPVANPERMPVHTSYDQKNLHVIEIAKEGQIEYDQVFESCLGETSEVTFEIPENLKALKLFPSDTGLAANIEISLNDQIIPAIKTNAVYQKGTYYLFSDREVPMILLTKQQLKGAKQLSLKIEYLYEGKYDEIMRDLIQEVKAKGLFAKKARVQAEQVVPVGKLQSVMNFNFEHVAYDKEKQVTHFRGWMYDRKNKLPVDMKVADDQFSYTFKPIRRSDLNEQFQLLNYEKYGFSLEIKDPKHVAEYPILIETKDGRVYRYLLNEAIKETAQSILQRARQSLAVRGISGTARWLLEHYKLNQETKIDEKQIQKELASFTYLPKISVVTPVYNVSEEYLAKCIQSLKNQFYTNWEFCLADDASTSPHIRPLLEKYAAEDERIKVIFREQNGHISEATNSAISIATGDYIGFMDNDDELAPQALFEVVKRLNQDREIDFIYTDEDKITEAGKSFDLFYKSAWNPELLLSHNYITHFVVVSRELLGKAGLLNSEFNGSQDYDFVLRATENANKIAHIPGMMYHWRAIDSSTAFDPTSKNYAYEAGRKALEATLKRRNIPAEVAIGAYYGTYKIAYQYETKPSVSIILTGENPNISTYVKQLLANTRYEKIEIVTNQELTTDDERVRSFVNANHQALVEKAQGEYLVILSADLLPNNEEWLAELLNLGQQSVNGIVMPKIVDSRFRIEHVGATIDLAKQRLAFPELNMAGKSLGYYYRIALPRNIQCASEECFLIRKTDYQALGLLNPALGRYLMGADLSLKMAHQLQKRVVYCSYATVKRLNRANNKNHYSIKSLTNHWTEEQLKDPYQNPKHL